MKGYRYTKSELSKAFAESWKDKMKDKTPNFVNIWEFKGRLHKGKSYQKKEVHDGKSTV